MLAHVGGLVLAPAQLLPGAVLGLLYWRRARTLAAQGRPVGGARQASFYAGLGLIVLTLASPVAHMAEELFAWHMAEHLLMADLGALALVCGLTGPVLQPLLRVRELGWLRALAHPVPALTLWTADLVAWHLPVLHEAALRSEAVHALQHILLVALGVNMWLAVLGPLPKPAWFGNLAALLYVLGVRLFGAALANVFVWTEDDLYPAYARGAWDVGFAGDQVAAGSIMMVEGSILTICLLGWLFLRAARQGEERQALMELAAASGVDLPEARASRAVSAGRGDELRRRIDQAGRQARSPGGR